MQRATAFISVCVCALALMLAHPARAGLKGDLNADGAVNGRDIPPFVAILLGIDTGTITQQCAADTNEDHAIGPDDIPPMIDLLLGRVPDLYAQQGHWDCAFDWGLPGALSTAIHGALVPTRGPNGETRGSVLTFGYYDNPATFIWNSETAVFTRIFPPPATLIANCPGPQPPRDTAMFCGGHSLLPDGKLLVTGGNVFGDDLDCRNGRAWAGPPFAFVFDGLGQANPYWSQIPGMNRGRWYPTNTTLGDGRVLVSSGYTECSHCGRDGEPLLEINSDVEVFNPQTGAFSVMGQFEFTFLYPLMHLLSSGSVFYAGEFPASFVFSPQSTAWQFVAHTQLGYRAYGTSVLVPGFQDKVMIIGGEHEEGLPPTNTTEVIDPLAPLPKWSYAAPLSIARCHPNGIILPDATILVVGGRVDECFGPGPFVAAYAAEVYDPSAPIPAWQLQASMDRPRMYHAIALLLPDGRVLTTGGTAVPGMADEQDASIYYPAYLFRGPRPQIVAAPQIIAFGQNFTITTPDAAHIASVALIRFSSVTHAVNMEQRYVKLDFQPGAVPDTLSAHAPPNGNLAPPGYYMLFVVNENRIPSPARIVKLQ